MSKTDFCRECHKKLNMRNEKMILGRIRCEKAPQVVPACINVAKLVPIIFNVTKYLVFNISTGMLRLSS